MTTHSTMTGQQRSGSAGVAGVNRDQLRRGRKPWPIVTRTPLLIEFCEIVERCGASAKEVEERAGVRLGFVSAVRGARTPTPTIVNVDCVLRAAGYRLAIVPDDGGSNG